MAETLARPRRRRRPSGAERLRGLRGRRRLAVRAARGRGQDARQLHAPRAAARALRRGRHQQPRRRPDRAAAGRPPRRRDAGDGRRRSTTATATTTRRRRAGCAAPRSASRSCPSWAPRTRCSPRRSPTATRSSGRRPRSRRSTTSSPSSRRWAPRSSGRTRTRSRSRASAASVAPSTTSCPTASRRGRSRSPPASPAATSSSRARTASTMDALVEVMGRAGLAVSCGPDRMEVDARGVGPRRPQAGRRRDRAVPGARDGHPAADDRAAHPGHGRFEGPRGDLRGPPRVDRRAAKMGAKIELKGPQRAIVHGPSKLKPRPSRSPTCAPARR